MSDDSEDERAAAQARRAVAAEVVLPAWTVRRVLSTQLFWPMRQGMLPVGLCWPEKEKKKEKKKKNKQEKKKNKQEKKGKRGQMWRESMFSTLCAHFGLAAQAHAPSPAAQSAIQMYKGSLPAWCCLPWSAGCAPVLPVQAATLVFVLCLFFFFLSLMAAC